MKKAVTLMELLIAVGLLMVIVFGATTFHFASTEFLRSSERKADVLNEITLVLEHLHKNVSLATGEPDNYGINVTNSGSTWTLTIRQDLRADINNVGTLWSPLLTPGNFADDRRVRYVFDSNNNTVTFEVLSSGVLAETLTNRFVDLGGQNAFIIYIESSGMVFVKNFALRYNPGTDDRFYANVSMADTSHSPPVPIIGFFPLSHSQNIFD